MRCETCNAEIPENAEKCPECGAPVRREEGQAESAAALAVTAARPEEKKGFPKKRLAAGGAAAIAVIVGAALYLGGAKDPKDVVLDAFKGVYASGNVNPSEEVFGSRTLAEAMEAEGGEMGIGLTIAGSPDPSVSSLSTGGMEFSMAFDQGDEAGTRILESLGIQYGGMDLASLQIYVDDTYMKFAVPEFSSRVFSVNYADDLAGQIERSSMMQEAGYELTEEDREAINGYTQYLSRIYGGDKVFDLAALWERYREGSQALSAFKEAMTAKKADAQTLSYNGSEVKCTGYDVVLPKDAVIQFARATAEFMLSDETMKGDILEYIGWIAALRELENGVEPGMTAESLAQELWDDLDSGVYAVIDSIEAAMASDVTMKVYVDGRGNLVSVDAGASFQIEDGETVDAGLETDLLGGAYPTQNGNAVLTLAAGEEQMELRLEKSGEYSDAALVSGLKLAAFGGGSEWAVTYSGRYDRATGDSEILLDWLADGSTISFTVNGIVDGLEKGESWHYTADSIRVEDDGQESIELTGEWYLNVLDGEVGYPEGTELDVLSATEAEWEEVGTEIMNNLYSLLMGTEL